MRRVGHLAGFLALLVVVPAFAADEKDAKKADAAEKPEAKEKLTKVGEVVGTLRQVEGSQKYITLQVSIPIVVPQVTGGARVGRSPAQRSVTFRVQQINQSIELQAHDELKVRVMRPPQDFDDKGKPKKYSQKELQELRGPDAKLPGYTADFDSLKPDQVVRVTVMAKKSAPVKAAPKANKKKDLDEDNEPAEPSERPFATVIVILHEPAR